MGTISRMYDNYGDASAVVRDLEAADVPHRDISLVANEHAHGRDAISFYTEQKVIMTRWF